MDKNFETSARNMKNNKLDVRNVTGDMGNGNGSIADNRTQDGALQVQEDDGSFSYYGWGYRNMLLCASSEVFPSGNFAGALRAAVPQHWNIPGSVRCCTMCNSGTWNIPVHM